MEPVVKVSTEHKGYLEWRHDCPADDAYRDEAALALLPIGYPVGWGYDEKTDTVTPSILCLSCGCHGFWEKGKWQGC
jgi:hypothetical protein